MVNVVAFLSHSIPSLTNVVAQRQFSRSVSSYHTPVKLTMAHTNEQDSGTDATSIITAGINHQPTETQSITDDNKPETKAETSPRSASDVEAAKEGLQKVDGDAGSVHDDRPKGVRFALLFSCLLLGNLFVGYVSPCGLKLFNAELTLDRGIAAAW